jgi:hypothetical protein
MHVVAKTSPASTCIIAQRKNAVPLFERLKSDVPGPKKTSRRRSGAFLDAVTEPSTG